MSGGEKYAYLLFAFCHACDYASRRCKEGSMTGKETFKLFLHYFLLFA